MFPDLVSIINPTTFHPSVLAQNSTSRPHEVIRLASSANKLSCITTTKTKRKLNAMLLQRPRIQHLFLKNAPMLHCLW
ncbi:hypothetical protein KC19_2G125300 [Ceratodon purpureus]|uniref:Uncharacterized protein n=1 Tax=Ceratodon purpureus TaxID=3225 RepID=A0A8T0IUV9_CERPU|nr:hypothetical protein KC19_2G125300 [Ceratodon purpureus]